MQETVNQAFNLLEPLLRQIGEELKAMFFSTDFEVRFKDKNELVTNADKLSEKYILQTLKENFPEHRILSEEAGQAHNSDSPYLWVIDPIDGTTNFAYHNPFFAIAVSLFYENEVVLGMIYNPILDEMYWAKKGEGAWLNGQKLQVNDNQDNQRIRFTYCHGNTDKSHDDAIKLYAYFKKHGGIRQLGSSALELALVARGITDAFVVPGALRWDVAAGILLVREAGGRVLDFSGADWHFDSEDMLADNGRFSERLLPVINEVLV